jgi:hypothetical protein
MTVKGKYAIKKIFKSQRWWCIPVIPVRGSLKQEDPEFEVRLAT